MRQVYFFLLIMLLYLCLLLSFLKIWLFDFKLDYISLVQSFSIVCQNLNAVCVRG